MSRTSRTRAARLNTRLPFSQGLGETPDAGRGRSSTPRPSRRNRGRSPRSHSSRIPRRIDQHIEEMARSGKCGDPQVDQPGHHEPLCGEKIQGGVDRQADHRRLWLEATQKTGGDRQRQADRMTVPGEPIVVPPLREPGRRTARIALRASIRIESGREWRLAGITEHSAQVDFERTVRADHDVERRHHTQREGRERQV